MATATDGIPTYYKAPDDVLDYQIDHSAWLDDDTISASAWDAPDGITLANDSNDDATATVWISGGDLNSRYIVTNTIITAAGRQKDKSFELRIRQE